MAKDDKQDDTSNNTSVRELGNVSLQCPKLTEANYTTWALMMETILKAYGIWETIVAKEGVTTNEKKENTSKAIIFQTLPQDILMQVAQYSTAKEVWDSIKVKNLGADLVQKARLQTLRSELETLRIKPNEKVSDFEGKLSSIMAKFKGLGETLEDKVLVRKLLNSVPKKFLPIVATIEQYQDLDEMSFEEAVGRLTAYEERIKSQDTLEANDQDKLLMASSNNKRYGKWRDKDFNKEGKESMKWKNNPNARRASTSQGTKDKSKLRCYDCGEYGHFAKECTNWKDKKKDKEQEALLISEDTAKMSYAYGGKKTRQEKEYIGMVKSYYEGTQRSRQERPGEVAENSSGTAGIERPQAFARISVEVEDALEKICTRTMIKKIIHGTMKGN
ncbi:zinc finger, CCHC-type containing protein [Tanacetum coccineum]